MVRAKFTCTSIEKILGWNNKFLWNYKFNVVTDGSDENKLFWEATPSGQIELQSIKEDLFEVGQTYYLDFTDTRNNGYPTS